MIKFIDYRCFTIYISIRLVKYVSVNFPSLREFDFVELLYVKCVANSQEITILALQTYECN